MYNLLEKDFLIIYLSHNFYQLKRNLKNIYIFLIVYVLDDSFITISTW